MNPGQDRSTWGVRHRNARLHAQVATPVPSYSPGAIIREGGIPAAVALFDRIATAVYGAPPPAELLAAEIGVEAHAVAAAAEAGAAAAGSPEAAEKAGAAVAGSPEAAAAAGAILER